MKDKLLINSESELEAAYRQMSQDYACEVEALEWAAALIGDVGDEVEKRLLFRQALRETENVKQTRELREKVLAAGSKPVKK